MDTDGGRRTRNNLPCALWFAALLVAAFFTAPLTEAAGERTPYAVLLLTVSMIGLPGG